ncbi:MAG: toxic anion resistance family protein [Pseudonocardiales bacterium]|nr:toxic anion resistance family protein [Pseudonocardiales bacterium]
MSDLDLGSSGSTPTSTPAPAATPGALVLAPPPPVQIVKDDEAAGAVPVDSARALELRQRADAFVNDLASIDVNSPAFTQKIASITSMGDQDMRASASVSSRMLDRPAAALKSAKGGGGNDAQTRVSNTLVDLRATVTELDPNRADLSGVKKVLKFIPGGDKVQRYFAKYETAQSHLNAIIKSLDSGQDELRKDNASIDTEKTNMWALMGKLSEYNELASALDTAVEQKIAELQAQGQDKQADSLKADALFPIRQRRQDIMTQMAVAVQGYLALDLVRRNNVELIKGVDRAQTTTIAALRTAIIVSQALSRQKLVLEQITALNETTSNLIERTSEQLKIQGGAINQQAAASTIDVAKLQAAFDNVFATMDAIDTFRAQATDSMAQTVTALEGQITRAKPYLERSRSREVSS